VKQQSVDNAEHRGVCANAQRENYDDASGNHRSAQHDPAAEARISN
jgi:hypothetical protein